MAEIGNLKMRDILNEYRTIKTEIGLSGDQIKGNEARVILIHQKLRDEYNKHLKESQDI